VLKGAQKVLQNSHPILYVENDRHEHSQELIQWLFDHGYRLWWHISTAYNPNNFLGEKTNVYDNICLVNMLGVPRQLNMTIEGLPEITDASFHPFFPNLTAPKEEAELAEAQKTEVTLAQPTWTGSQNGVVTSAFASPA
jgi:hypothetical protein